MNKLNRWVTNLAKLCAILAGVLLTVITLMTCFSIIGRNTIGVTMSGDFELTGIAAGAAIALFMPWCQIKRGNIIVDFFTAKASDASNAVLDRFGAFILGMMMALLAWRASLGGLNAFDTHSSTMMMGFPEWLVYCAIVPPLVLTALIGFLQALSGVSHTADDHAHEIGAAT